MSIDQLQITEFEQQVKENNKRVKNFCDIVDRISELSDEKKVLYREIYENAIVDRQHAYGMYRILVNICGENSTEHAVHGRTIAGFIEKMSKANDQIIRLCDLLRRAEEREQIIDPDFMFDKIQKQQRQ